MDPFKAVREAAGFTHLMSTICPKLATHKLLIRLLAAPGAKSREARECIHLVTDPQRPPHEGVAHGLLELSSIVSE